MPKSLIRIWLNTDAAGGKAFCEQLADLDLLRQYGGGSKRKVKMGKSIPDRARTCNLRLRRARLRFEWAAWPPRIARDATAGPETTRYLALPNASRQFLPDLQRFFPGGTGGHPTRSGRPVTAE